MWKKRVAFRLLSIGSAFIVAATSLEVFKAVAQDSDEQAIHHVEDRIEEATGRNDADALARLWATDYIFVNPAGQRLTAAQRLRIFRSGETKAENYKRDQESIRVYGTTAVVVCRSTVTAAQNGADVASQHRVTTILVKRAGRWQVVSEQSSRIRGTASAAAISTSHHQFEPAPTSPADDGEVQQVEQRIAEATGKSDADALETLWSPEYVWVGPSGMMLTRAQRLANIRSGQEKGDRYTIDLQDVRMYGTTAVAIFRSTIVGGVYDGKDISSRRCVTNVLVKQDGRWQAVWQHSTLIQQP